jgi:hypothetical protein
VSREPGTGTLPSPPASAGISPQKQVASTGGPRSALKSVAYALLFFACVYPYSVGGLGVNYTFLLLPLLIALVHGRLQYPGDALILAMSFYLLVFFVACLYQIEYAALSVRRFTSFAIFMSMFAYSFINLDETKIAAFKTALVAISVYLSFESAYQLLLLTSQRIVGFEAKDLIGTQRFGFIYLIAFWLVYLDPQQKKLLRALRYPVLAVLAAGLLLTFSRSSIVALLLSYLCFGIVRYYHGLANLSVRALMNGIMTTLGIAILVMLLFTLFPVAFDFFNARLLTLFTSEDRLLLALDDASSSEGTRLMIAMQVLDFVGRNPLTGSGYLGVWILRSVGSAHGQYVDVLFRTGFIGLTIYLCILFGLMRYLRKEQEALFWGVFSVIVYGLFHETFKESHGDFILAFLVGLMAQSWRQRRAARRARRAAVRRPMAEPGNTSVVPGT